MNALKPKSLSYRTCLVLAAMFTGLTAYELYSGWTIGGPQFDAIVTSGYAAVVALALSLFVSPIVHTSKRMNVKLPLPYFMAFRRSLGLLATWFAAVHLAVVTGTYLHGKWGALTENVFLSSGLLTFALLLLLSLSSFPSLCKRLKIKMWKELHMLVYACGVFAAFHLSLGSFSPDWVLLLNIIILPFLLVMRLSLRNL